MKTPKVGPATNPYTIKDAWIRSPKFATIKVKRRPVNPYNSAAK